MKNKGSKKTSGFKLCVRNVGLWLGIVFAATPTIFSNPALGAERVAPTFGIQGGLSLANLSGPNTVTTSNITGFAVGGLIELPLTESVLLQPEVLFVQRGATIVDAGSVRLAARYDALQIPVLVKIRFGEGIRPFLFAGPSFNFAVSNRLTVETPGGSSAVNFSANTFDLAGTLGLGVEFGSLFVSARYELGFIEVNSNSANWRSQGLLAFVGMKF